MDGIQHYLDDLRRVLEELPVVRIEEAIILLYHARLNGRQVFIMGNGGSASTASHFACDLGKGTVVPGRPRFRVMALTDNTALFSAYANDEGYENVFVQQLASFVQPGDVVIGISTSGNSANVLRAIELADARHATTIGFTGFDGGQLANLVAVEIRVPSDNIERIEDVHLVLEHVISSTLRRAIRQGDCSIQQVSLPMLWGLQLVEGIEIDRPKFLSLFSEESSPSGLN
jgi:D-sedoheptulose 7-phosphate isomerase